jgi:drug/metabolite transporter (DMT)-like permease
LISTLWVIVVLVASGFSTTVGVVIALVGACTYGLSAAYARRMIDAIGRVHDELLATFRSR